MTAPLAVNEEPAGSSAIEATLVASPNTELINEPQLIVAGDVTCPFGPMVVPLGRVDIVGLELIAPTHVQLD